MLPLKTNARVITSWRCDKACQGCCNSYSSIMAYAKHIKSFSELKQYDKICITGGEPMLKVEQLIVDIEAIRSFVPNAKVYLYTALYQEGFDVIANLVDGIHFTLHEGATEQIMNQFHIVQNILFDVMVEHPQKSFRLYIDPRVEWSLELFPKVWSKVEMKPWMTEEELIKACPSGLPQKEDLFILDRVATSEKEFKKHIIKLEKKGKL